MSDSLMTAIQLHQQGNFSEAEEAYRQVLRGEPENIDALMNLGLVLFHQGRAVEAIPFFEKVLETEPRQPDALFNLGHVLGVIGRREEAIALYTRVLDVQPQHLGALHNAGVLLRDLGRLDEAEQHLKLAITFKPDFAEAYFNLGAVYGDEKRIEEAIHTYKKALSLNPRFGQALVALYRNMRFGCMWDDIEAVEVQLDILVDQALADGKVPIENPWAHISRVDDPAKNLAVAKAWSAKASASVAGAGANLSFNFDERRTKEGPIVLGYLSSDFIDHPGGHLMRSLFGLHDREKFQVNIYSYGKDDGSEVRKQIREECDNFVDIVDMSAVEAARKIYEDKVDILIDRNGHTMHGRLEISALRPAPVQISFMGYAGTTGADYLDYIFLDEVVAPEEHLQHYGEKVVWLPTTYQVNNRAQKPADTVYTRKQCGLPEKGFIFSSFNRAKKFDPVMFALWMRLLHRVDGSVLWLYESHPYAAENLRKEAKKHDIDPARLVFAGRLSKEEYLARGRLADLTLDTRIYGGHTLTSDSLCSGVPVVTLLGRHQASRLCASILTTAGLEELITHSFEEYEALATDLAVHPEKISALKAKVKKAIEESPLYDTEAYARNLEKGFLHIWQRFQQGETPEHFAIGKEND